MNFFSSSVEEEDSQRTNEGISFAETCRYITHKLISVRP